MYATFLLAENGALMLMIKRKPLQAQRLYCLSNYRLPLCSVGAGQQKMALRWSPEQIAGRAKHDKEPFSISFPTICRAIDKGVLPPQLKKIMRFKWKHKKCKTEDKCGKIPNTTTISERPAGAETRTRFGHWESDTVLGMR